MKPDRIIPALAIVALFPLLAQARPLTLTTEMASYRGEGAYLALYLVDAHGQYQRTLWVAGRKVKYYKHLGSWARGSGLRRTEYDGMTGASLSGGKVLVTRVELDDALIDAGYRIQIDTAVEDKVDVQADVVAPLTTDGMGKPVGGKKYIQSFTYRF